MVSVDGSTLFWVSLFALIGIVAMVKPIFKATSVFWQSVWFLLAVRKYRGNMREALRRLPRLAIRKYKTGQAAYNLRQHLVYHFEQGGRVENKVTQDRPWLDSYASWLVASKSDPEQQGANFAMRITDTETHRYTMHRTWLTLLDERHPVIRLTYEPDSTITGMLADEMWPFLMTTAFYSPDIKYIAIENCPDIVAYVSTAPSETIVCNGIEYTIFAPSPRLLETIGIEAPNEILPA